MMTKTLIFYCLYPLPQPLPPSLTFPQGGRGRQHRVKLFPIGGNKKGGK